MKWPKRHLAATLVPGLRAAAPGRGLLTNPTMRCQSSFADAGRIASRGPMVMFVVPSWRQ